MEVPGLRVIDRSIRSRVAELDSINEAECGVTLELRTSSLASKCCIYRPHRYILTTMRTTALSLVRRTIRSPRLTQIGRFRCLPNDTTPITANPLAKIIQDSIKVHFFPPFNPFK
jgi:hypothetical protein